MKRKIFVLVVTLLMCLTAIVIVPRDFEVKATLGGGEGEEGIGLDFDYMWEVTEDLSNIVHEYPPGLIPKGRAFGTWGANETADYLEFEMNNVLNLENVDQLQLGPVQGVDYFRRRYTSKVIVDNFRLTIDRDDYPLPNTVPTNETFVFPSGLKDRVTGCMDHNYTFLDEEDIRVLPKDITGDWSPVFGDQNIDYYNVSCTTVNLAGIIVGNVSYIASNETIPEDQECKIFLIEEEDGCEDKLDNITNATGVILLHDDTRGYSAQNVTDHSFSIVRVDSSDNNLTEVKELLENGTMVIADNLFDNETIIFTSNLGSLYWWPDYNFFIIDQVETIEETLYFGDSLLKSNSLWLLNYVHDYKCKGLILYDLCNETYVMVWSNRDWWRLSLPFPGLPIFSINNSVGSWLVDHADDDNNTISGYMNQRFEEEKHIGIPSIGVEAYNVIGNITIDHSPGDAIVVISNRYDGWWGETPGDSGAGGALVLGIAKYFKDYDITPKYNLTFLFSTGEEYAYRGAQHYSDSHEDNNITLFIGTDQLGINQSDMFLEPRYKETDTRKIVYAITNETHYTERTGYEHRHRYDPVSPEQLISGTEDIVYQQRTGSDCDTITFGKGGNWDNWHKSGMNYAEGDSLKHMDRNDLNVTFELLWNVTKYFTVNPDCWFEGDVCYESFDSPSDGDTLVDSIRANFTVNTSIPQDKVRVNVSYSVSWPGHQSSWIEANGEDYIVTSEGNNLSIVFPISDSYNDVNFSIRLRLYNSTGRINEIVDIGSDNYNDTSNSSDTYHLYHPLGYPRKGALSESTNDRITGSVFTANENCYADNITAYIYAPTGYPPYKAKCMIYRADDSTLIGETDEQAYGTAYGGAWKVYPFSDPKPTLVKDTEYILVLWSEGAQLYYNTFNSERGRYNESTYGSEPPEDPVFINESRMYSLYCSYTPFGPEITSVSADPNVVGFGFNVTISADVIGEVSGVDTVKVNISYPDSTFGNFTMNNTEGDTYEYVFSDTWQTGWYNYTIWAWGNGGSSNSSSGHSFNVSAQATISIATLKDSYGSSEYINITDPPTPPDDFYLVDRGLTWDEYYNALTGENVLEITAGPINYQDENNEWTPINCTIDQLEPDHPAYSYGYRAGNERGLYNTYFKPNVQDDWPIAFAYNKSTDPVTHVIRSKLVGVGYLDPSSNWAYEYLQNVQSSQGQIHGNSVTYEDVFTGTDVTWSYESTKLKEDIIMSNATKTLLQNHPPSEYGLSNESSYLVFITRLDYHNLNMHNTSGILDGNFTVSNGRIDFKDAMGHIKCSLPIGEAYELHNEEVRQQLTYRIIQHNDEYYLLSGLKVSDLNEMQFPVVIDPDLSMMTVYSTSSDGYIYKYNSNYNTAWTSSTGTVIDSVDFIRTGQYKNKLGTYYIWRGFLFFNTSSLPSNAYITQATLSVYKKSDSSSTDFDIVIQNGQPTYPRDPLQTGDYNKNYYSGNGGSLNTANFSNGRNNIPLTNYSWLTKEGMTKLCLRSSRDIGGTSPSGLEYVQVYSSEKSGTFYDPKLSISYRNQSKIKNTGSTNISGYLLIQVQYDNETLGEWVVDHDTVNETTPRTINSGEQLALDVIFNGQVNTDDLSNGNGTYRVYAAFRDPDGNILQTEDETYLVSSYEFDVTFA